MHRCMHACACVCVLCQHDAAPATHVSRSKAARVPFRSPNPPICIPPYPLLLLPPPPSSFSTFDNTHTHTLFPHLLRLRLQLPHALPPISESSLSYITTPFSHKPPTPACAYTPAITETVCSTDVKLSALFFCSTPPSSPSLSGLGRLGYALITLLHPPLLPATMQQTGDSTGASRER